MYTDEMPSRPGWPTAGKYGRPATARQKRFLDRFFVPCGTVEGWEQHQRSGEMPCRECDGAHDARLRALDDARVDNCGSNEGWQRHRRLRQEPCIPCQEARAEYEASKCGTTAGVHLHRRNRTPLCDNCRAAHNEYLAAWQAAHPEKCRAYQRDYYERHREQRIAYSAAYRAAQNGTAT